ncbi:MAG: type I DNA topoisomerase [Anaerolineales bacterium]|nr:type I DNA topoisomerase [Anaerolineales bacterium]
MTKLIIVESAKKAGTIKGMLGAEFVVKATSGHILEMPADEMHVNLQDFTPTLHLIRGKGKKLEELRKAAAQAETVYLGTDMDREGEAIAQHVAERLGQPIANKIRRITFTAITRTDLQAALASPRSINLKLVEAQTARRVIDRLVGYMVSPVLWKGLSGLRRLSAGRVQSPALWLVVERERAIRVFVPEEWWSIEAELSKTSDPTHQKFWATLFKIKGRKPELKTEADAQKVLADLTSATWRVLNVDKGTRVRKPYPPFTTDSLQQAASSQLGFNPRLTMKLAQELYEGVKLGEGKAVGLITYIRTDSVAVAPEAQQAARDVITKYFGEAYLPAKPPIYQTRDKTAQEAHEAIRPVDPWKTPKGIETYLTPPQYQLYRLIWRRFIASQMKPAIYDTVTVDIETIIAGSATQYLFRATGSTLRFAGFLKVYGVDADAEESRQKKTKGSAASENEREEGTIENESMPDLVKGDDLTLHQLLPKQHFTQPPKRYTEAQLIGALKKLGLGRPSTYATIVETLKDRNYVAVEKKRLYPTPLGFQVCELLERHVQLVIDVGFTAQMEENLDRIAHGQANRLTVMGEFYGPFKDVVDQALAGAAAERQPAARPPKTNKTKRPAGRSKSLPTSDKVGQVCPECKEGTLVAKQGKYGPFLGCSRYAAGCRFTEKLGSGGRTKRQSTRRKKRRTPSN